MGHPSTPPPRRPPRDRDGDAGAERPYRPYQPPGTRPPENPTIELPRIPAQREDAWDGAAGAPARPPAPPPPPAAPRTAAPRPVSGPPVSGAGYGAPVSGGGYRAPVSGGGFGAPGPGGGFGPPVSGGGFGAPWSGEPRHGDRDRPVSGGPPGRDPARRTPYIPPAEDVRAALPRPTDRGRPAAGDRGPLAAGPEPRPRRRQLDTSFIGLRRIAATLGVIVVIVLFVAALLWGLDWLKNKNEQDKYDDYGITRVDGGIPGGGRRVMAANLV